MRELSFLMLLKLFLLFLFVDVDNAEEKLLKSVIAGFHFHFNIDDVSIQKKLATFFTLFLQVSNHFHLLFLRMRSPTFDFWKRRSFSCLLRFHLKLNDQAKLYIAVHVLWLFI